MKRRKLTIASWIVAGILMAGIVVESALPSDISGMQSDFLSRILVNFINDHVDGDESPKRDPLGFKAFTLDERYTNDGHTIVIGTTKLINYTLDFGEYKDGTFRNEITIKRTDGSDKQNYTVTVTHNGDFAGLIRILPYSYGDYSFQVIDEANHVKDYAFTVIERMTPTDEDFIVEPAIEAAVGTPMAIPLTLTSEVSFSSATEDSQDHYLQRFFDLSKLDFESEDESIFTVEGNYVVPVGVGEADLLLDGEYVSSVVVTPGDPGDNDPLIIETDGSNIHPLDYDYYLKEERIGVQIYSNYDDVIYSCSDDMMARVSNAHKEILVDGTEMKVPGGFVQGFRKTGTCTIYAYRASDPTNVAEMEFTCENAVPDSMTLALTKGNEPVVSGQELASGDSVTVRATFTPKNTFDTTIRGVSSDESIIKITSATNNSLTFYASSKGEASIRIYSVANEELSQTFNFTVTLPPVIQNYSSFASAFRKGIGHFLLFLLTAIWTTLAYFFTFEDKGDKLKWGSFGISIGTGVVLAGLSELIQAIPALGRGPSWFDVLIDSLGFLAGTVLVAAIILLVTFIKKKKSSSNPKIEE